MNARLPVTILGGYLGAGKTTLVNQLLRHADGRRIAVLVNDFGTLAIDADLILSQDGGVLSLAGGCVCCSFGDDLVSALIDLAKRAPRPDHVLIETSGVALPGAVARSLNLLFDYVLDAIIVMADVETTSARLADPYLGDTLQRQFADADLIVLNKCDLAPAEAIATLNVHLREAYPLARLIETAHGQLSPDVALGLADENTPRRRYGGVAHSLASHDHASLRFDGKIDVAALAEGLARLDLVRAKGFVIDRRGTWHAIQLAGRRTTLSPPPVDLSGPARLVCIAHNHAVDRAALEALLLRCGASDIHA